MKQLSKHQVNKLTAKELEAKLPFQIVADGKVFAVVLPAKDITKLDSHPKHNVTEVSPLLKKVSDLKELPLSKKRQAENRLPNIY
jgi:hypothetical protein